MSTIIKDLKILTESGYIYGDLEIENERIKNINENKNLSVSDKIIIPGFFDIHTHGAVGKDFTTVKSIDEIKEILDFYMSHGVTSVFPTLLTEKDEVIFKQLELIYEASKKYKIIKGVHLEGPFLSKVYKGAQLEECLQDPTIEKCKEFIEHSHGLFKYMTLAPELQGSSKVIDFLTKNGIKVSMGHSDATFDDCSEAINNGAICITHCLNAMKGLHQHFPSITTAAFYYDNLYNEVIIDGIHVHPEMVEFIRKIKGNDKVIGVTDSLMAAGLPDGNYFIGDTPITVSEGDCKITATGVRAGSTLNMEKCFKNVKKFCSLKDLEASKITSLNACKMLEMDKELGSIKEGKYADFIVFNSNYEIEEVYISGEKVI